MSGQLWTVDDRPIDGSRRLTLALYDTPVEGEPFFMETLDVLLHKGVFTAELGAATEVLDLDLFSPTMAGVWLGVSVGNEAELQPRLRFGEVPIAAYAHRAGDSTFLGGLGPEAFRLEEDPISFSELVNVPAELADGDNDLLAEMSCAEGESPVFKSGAWVCQAALADTSCEEGFVLKGVKADGSAECVRDEDKHYDGSDFALSGKGCDTGYVLEGIDGSGLPRCVPNPDTLYGVAENQGLSLGEGLFGIRGCPAGEILKSDGNGWACAADEDANTTYSADASRGLTLGGDNVFGLRVCSLGQVLKSTGAGWECAEDVDTNTDTTYTADASKGLSLSGTSFGLQICPSGQVLKSNGNGWECADDVDTNTTYTAAANKGLSLSGTAFGLQTCPSGQILKSNGTNWACEEDKNDVSFAKRNTSCAPGRIVTGVDAQGDLICRDNRWTQLPRASIGTIPRGGSTASVAYDVPPVVPSSAMEILVSTAVWLGGNNSDSDTYFFVHTREGTNNYGYYMHAHGYSQSAYSFNSENQWLPLTTERKVRVDRSGAQQNGTGGSTIYVLGYR